MRIKFRITRNIWPRTLAEWEGFLIAEVRVLECSTRPEWKGTTQTFKGDLPSRAPYFIFEAIKGPFVGEDTHNGNKKEVIMGGKGTQWTYRRYLTVEGIRYILLHEFPLAARREDAVMRDFTATRALDEIRRMVQEQGLMYDANGKVDEETFQALPVFQQAVARSCDYFRLEYMEPLRKVYDRSARPGDHGKDQMRQLQSMSPQKLVALYKMSRESPWLLCISRFSRRLFDMKPMSEVKALRLAARNDVSIPKRFKVAISILQHIRKKIYKDGGHTIFNVSWLLKHYWAMDTDMTHQFNTRTQVDDAIQWLVRNGGLVWAQEPDVDNQTLPEHERHGVLMFPKTQYQIGVITDTFLAVMRRAHSPEGPKAYPEYRECGVVTIPPTLTGEQTQAMLHVMHNWLTLVVGPPGRGKTAIIEAAFAHFYRITNITYVGTMVASQRERLGGRVESSHTAHSLYKTMRAHPQETREHYLNQIEVLIWDEFSNVDEALLAKVLKCFRDVSSGANARLCRMLFIFDIHQINPINPSCCAKDLIEAFPMHIRELTVNLRVDPVYRALADLALLILAQRIDDIDFGSDLYNSGSAVVLMEPDSCAFGEDLVADGPGFEMVRNVMRHFRICGEIEDPMDFKFITPKRSVRKQINDAVEILLFNEGWIGAPAAGRRVTVRRGFDIYPGAIIAISGATFKPPKVAPKKPVHEVRNGEILRVVSITSYELDPEDKRYSKSAYYVTCQTRSGIEKNMILEKNIHVDPMYVIRGHCVTIDASQGSEWPMTCAFYHDGAGDHTWITMERLYVSTSRAQRGMVIVAPGGRETLKKIASRRMPRRYSALSYALSHDPELQALQQVVPLEQCTERALLDPEDMVLLDDVRQAAVPRFPGRTHAETDGTGAGNKRRKH